MQTDQGNPLLPGKPKHYRRTWKEEEKECGFCHSSHRRRRRCLTFTNGNVLVSGGGLWRNEAGVDDHHHQGRNLSELREDFISVNVVGVMSVG